jgi:hypothetical protein
MRELVEKEASRVLALDNIAQFILISVDHVDSELRFACGEYVNDNRNTLTTNRQFRNEVEKYSELCLFLLESATLAASGDGSAGSSGSAAAGSSQGASKRRRLSLRQQAGSEGPGTAESAARNEIEQAADTIAPTNHDVDV